MTLSRRTFLVRSGLVGCSLAASPLVTPISLAAAPWENRLVVIILRGGMDGLNVVQPYGDPDYAALRKSLAGGPENGATDLDGFFALHRELSPLMPMWRAGQLGFVHAVSTPYRDKRSHFDGQDLLEAGTVDLASGVRDGWLNRLLQAVPGVTTETAYAIGTSELQVLSGSAPVANWTPDTQLSLSSQGQRLMSLVMEDDPVMHAALAEAQMLTGEIDEPEDKRRKPGHVAVAEFAARQLSKDARIAAFSINGWDTHRAQSNTIGRPLRQLADTLMTLRQTMQNGAWGKTAVIALTEFGRTARENGTRGTDHGTGGLMLLAGGAIAGGRVHGKWPGLSEADLYARRDLMPVRDVRAYAAWVMSGLFGLDRATLEAHVFPNLDLGPNPNILL